MGAAPVQVPGVAESVLPTRLVPLTTGSVWLTGLVSPASTAALLSENAVAEPLEFFPVTRTRICLPRSAATSLYVLLVAPLMLEHVPVVEHRCHRVLRVGVGLPVQVPV